MQLLLAQVDEKTEQPGEIEPKRFGVRFWVCEKEKKCVWRTLKYEWEDHEVEKNIYTRRKGVTWKVTDYLRERRILIENRQPYTKD